MEQCQVCKNNEATVHFKQVFNGAVKEIFVCKDCARRNGFDAESPLALTDFLLGMTAQAEQEPVVNDRSCHACHMRLSDFKKTSRLGCPSCYDEFAGELAPLLAGMHKGRLQHTGKAPSKAGMTEEMLAAQKALKEAVAAQNFEEAARLRDLLKCMKVPKAGQGGDAGRN